MALPQSSYFPNDSLREFLFVTYLIEQSLKIPHSHDVMNNDCCHNAVGKKIGAKTEIYAIFTNIKCPIVYDIIHYIIHGLNVFSVTKECILLSF